MEGVDVRALEKFTYLVKFQKKKFLYKSLPKKKCCLTTKNRKIKINLESSKMVIEVLGNADQ